MIGRWFFHDHLDLFLDHPGDRSTASPGARSSTAATLAIGIDRRLHDAAEPALLPARPIAEHSGRDPGRVRPLRSHLRISGSADHAPGQTGPDATAPVTEAIAGRSDLRRRLVPVDAAQVPGPEADRTRARSPSRNISLRGETGPARSRWSGRAAPAKRRSRC